MGEMEYGWRRRRQEGEMVKRQRNRLLLLILCNFHKLVFLISSIDQINRHVSLIGGKTGGKGG
jgi:hypothetical protein